MSTATKLEYLNDTKGLLKDSINNLGGNITSQTTFRQYATELDSIYSKLPKVSGTGTELSLSPTIKGRLSSVINGDTYQFSTTGKNLLPFTNQDFTLKNVKYYVQNGSLYLNGTSTGETSANDNNFKNNFSFTLPAGTYYFNRGQAGNSLSLPSYLRKYSDNSDLAVNWGSFTLQEETQVFLGFYVYQKTFSNNLIDIQLESGSSATSYEPYTGGIASPNPSYPQDIQCVTGLQNISVCGKNLFDGSRENIYFNSSYQFQNYTNALTTNYILANPGDIFTISCNAYSDGIVIASFDENYNCLLRNATRGTSLTHTCPAGTKYIIGSNVNGKNLNTQLEKGSSATEYEPYQNQEYEINLGKNLLDISYSKLGYSIDSSTGEVVQFANNVCGENYIKVQPNTKYTISSSKEIGFLRLSEYNNNKQNIQRTQGLSTYSYTITTSSNTYYVRWSLNYNQAEITQQILESLDLQLEKSSQATSYSPYFTPIKLNKIGDYQDYIVGTPNNWVLYKNIGKVVLDGTNAYGGGTTGTNAYYLTTNITTFEDNAKALAYSNMFQPVSFTNRNNGLDVVYSQNGSLTLRTANNTSIDWNNGTNRTNWLNTNKPEVLYVLATETTEPITNTELIEDLNNFYNAKSYNGQTNISVEGNLPMILSVSALKGDTQ